MIARQILLLAGSIGVIGANAFALSPIASNVAASLPGVHATTVMSASASYGLATAASALLLAPAIDRIDRRVGLSVALATVTLALVTCALSPTLTFLCIGQAIAGLAAGCALPAVYALSADLGERGHESETLGLVLTGWTASLVVGVSLSALIAEFVHWRLVFGCLAIVAGWLAVGVLRCRGMNAGTPARGHSSLFAVLRLPRLASMLVLVAFYMTAFYGLYAYLGSELTAHLGLSTASAGLAPLAYGLGFGVAAPVDRLIDRHGTVILAPGIFLALGSIYMALAFASNNAVLLVALCLPLGLANHVGLNLIVGDLTSLDPARRGAIMGLYSAVTYLSVSAGTLLYRPLYAFGGLTACALASAACVLPALAVSLARARRPAISVAALRTRE